MRKLPEDVDRGQSGGSLEDRPRNVGLASCHRERLLQLELQEAGDKEGDSADDGSDADLLERLLEDVTLGTERVDDLVKHW